MAVSASLAPRTLSPVRSPLWTRIQTDTYAPPSYTTVKATFRITFLTGVANSDSIIIDTGLGTVEMVCTALDQDGLHFDEGATSTQAAQAFYLGCLANHLLTTNYVITWSGDVVTFVARAAGTIYNLESVTFSPTGLGSSSVLVTGLVSVPTGNYSIIVRPWIGDGQGTFIPVGELQCVPDGNNGVSFDLAKLLRGAFKLFPGQDLEGDWPPIQEAPNVLLHTKSTRPFYLEYYARFGRPAITQGVQRIGSPASPLWAWLAGYERQHYDMFQIWQNRIEGLVGAPHLFLTWRDRILRRFVTQGEQHYLGWYHWPMLAGVSSLQLQAKLTHMEANGTDLQTTDWSDRFAFAVPDDLPRRRVGSFNVGYAQLTMQSLLPADRVPYSYTVRINETITGPKSEEITFYLAPADANDVHIQFVSSLGVVENVRARGTWVRSGTPEHRELMRVLGVGDRSITDKGAFFSEPLGVQHLLKVTISSPSQREHEANLDILGSPEIKHVDYDLDIRFPLRLLKADEQVVAQKGNEDENVRLINLVFAADDPSALVTLYVHGSTVVANEDDSLIVETDPGGG